MKNLFYILTLFFCMQVSAQSEDPIYAMNMPAHEHESVDTTTKRFSNSESSEYTFIVNPDLNDNSLLIKTDYTREYKVRFIDYWGKSRKVYSNVSSDKKIDIADLERGIFIMNIFDEKNNKLLTSQVLNLRAKDKKKATKRTHRL